MNFLPDQQRRQIRLDHLGNSGAAEAAGIGISRALRSVFHCNGGGNQFEVRMGAVQGIHKTIPQRDAKISGFNALNLIHDTSATGSGSL